MLVASGNINFPNTSQNIASLLVQAGKTPLRALVRNISAQAAEIVLAYDDATTVQDPPISNGNSYTLSAGQADTFMLAPGQKLYAGSTSAGARVCVAISEALPIDHK
jgi:hypothetical protein